MKNLIRLMNTGVAVIGICCGPETATAAENVSATENTVTNVVIQSVIGTPKREVLQKPVKIENITNGVLQAKTQADVQIATASAVLEHVRVLVRSNASGAAAMKVSSLLSSSVQGALTKAGYRIVYEGPSDIIADMTVTAEQKNKRGSREVYKGDVDVSVTRSPEFNKIVAQHVKDVIARNRFDVVGWDGLGTDEALKSVADRMNAAVSPWLADACQKVGGKLETCTVTISNGWFLGPNSDYPTRFVSAVRGLQGVYDCTILVTDNANKMLKARIVYDRDQFPDGIMNRLYTIKELNIHR